jgi:sec-independent protein translocase protein TatC
VRHDPQPFTEHIRELRTRVFWVVTIFVLATSAAYQFRDALVAIVLSPLGHQKLIYLTPGGGFSFIFAITMDAGALAVAPFLIFHLYKFVAPALPPSARKHAAGIFIASTLLMLTGVLFGYFVAVPAALSFLTNFADAYVSASLTAESYLSFVMGYLVGLGLLFQLPLLLLFWHWISPLSPKKLWNSERFVIVFSFIAAAAITPTPDVFNQCIIALPIIAIYQLGVLAVWLMPAKIPQPMATVRESASSGWTSGPVLADAIQSLRQHDARMYAQNAAARTQPRSSANGVRSVAPAHPVMMDGFTVTPKAPMQNRSMRAMGESIQTAQQPSPVHTPLDEATSSADGFRSAPA